MSLATSVALRLPLAAAAAFTACEGGDSEPSPPDANEPAPAQPLFGGSLTPETRYRTCVFEPALTFAVPDGDWFARVTDSRTLLLLEGIVLEVRGRPTVATIEAYPRDFARFAVRANRVLHTFRFAGSR